ncbi:MAG: carbohydrate binding family 9 domain-containing protein, partial [Acidobacteria bacterium]|nr:carbohydrate binding family 9 domain-containing protein [Acidobacteriota bacterium]
MAPASITRDAAHQATVRAIKLSAPLAVDGRLDESVYTENEPFGDLIQVVPALGQPATERTDLWLMFDDKNVYVAAKVFDSAPPSQWVANEYRRDTNQLRQNDHIGIGLDTYYDRRSAFMFYATPLGAFSDYSVIDEGASNTDWNPVWNVRTGRFDGGWTMEMIIPFKSLRFTGGANQNWGLQVRRSIRRKNEWAYLTPVPQSMAGPMALNRVSVYGTATGIDAPPAGRTFEIKPYVVGRTTTDRLRNPPISNDPDLQLGGDVKYGITANLVADFTYNTDFAQVEVDEQQLNLTRFSLFFPEKRDFFLEGRGIFDFGRGGASSGGGGNVTQSSTPSLFYSRRIGLNRGRVVPIEVGGRVTGKVGKYGIGLVNIQADNENATSPATPSTNFSVVRIKRDVFKKGNVGFMATNRSSSNVAGANNNLAYGVDGSLGLFDNLQIGGYWARTETACDDRPAATACDDLKGDSESYQGRFDYFADRYGARFEYLKVGDNFNPEVGFIQRDNFRRGFTSLRFSPRPKDFLGVRKLTWQADLEHLENGQGALETRVYVGKFVSEFNNSDTVTVEATRDYEMIVQPFPV